jgi:cytochrome c-type biogenesis protein CcmF
MAPIGLLILGLMGMAPLFGWRKTSAEALRKAFTFPTAVMAVMMLVHVLFGGALGYDAIVDAEVSGDGWSDVVLSKFEAIAPLITVGLVAFNFAVVLQEFQRGVVARRKNAKESVLEALLTLVARSRRRYGGYIVHIGVGFMFLGFVGKAWDLEQEATLTPGQGVEVGDYSLTYRGARMETDAEKRMVFADVDVSANGRELGTYSPAQFIFIKGQMPTSEVSMVHRVKDDLYMVVGSVNPTTKRATFRFHVNPLVSWIWLGVIIMVGGAMVSLWPQVSWRHLGVWGSIRLATGATAAIMFSVLVASTPGRATQIIPSRVLADQEALLSAVSDPNITTIDAVRADPAAVDRTALDGR